MTDNPRDDALQRMMRELDLDERAAGLELRKRLRLARNIVALAYYLDWALEHQLVQAGPLLQTVNYKRVEAICDSKPYTQKPLVLDVWSLLALSNTATWNRYRRESGIQVPLDEVLMLNRTELVTLKRSRSALIKRINT